MARYDKLWQHLTDIEQPAKLLNEVIRGSRLMSSTLNLSLTDELRAFVDANCGDGTLYATPSEFVRDLLRQHKAAEEARQVREKILAGYQDAIAGRTVEFKGDLTSLLKKAKK